MFSKIWRRERIVNFGLIALSLFAVGGSFGVAHLSSGYIIARDATDLAEQWTQVVIDEFRNPSLIEGDGDRSSHIEMVSGQLLAAFQSESSRERRALGGAESADNPRATDAADDPSQFRRGAHFSQIHRYIIFGRDGSIFAKSGRFSDFSEFDIRKESAGKIQFDIARTEGQTATLAMPDHITRIFAPYKTSKTIPYIVAVDVDHYAADLLLAGALNLVMLLTCGLFALGVSAPLAIAWRRAREKRHTEEQLRFMALHDGLTGLPNRVQLRDSLRKALARSARDGEPMAVMCLDLDRFKNINDTLGHSVGDQLLQVIAQRLNENLRDTDTAGRLGGDEFAVVAESIGAADEAAALAERLLDALVQPCIVGGHELIPSASIGIAIGPWDGDDPDELLTFADLALYRAKTDGRRRYSFFEEQMERSLRERRTIENDLRNALREDHFQIYYQPLFDQARQKICGYEALLRWRHPERGMIPPVEFIPIAEETGLICEIGAWVLEHAMRYARDWPGQETLAINLSPVQFKTQDIVEQVRRLLAETGFPANRLELEITETLLLHDTVEVVTALQRLDALGCKIVMDDFGTGYSSLSYLTRFPVKKIKIDKSFVDGLGLDPQTGAIVSTILGLGRSLNVTVTAEGVETQDQVDILNDWGCNQIQGYFYGRPAPTIATDSDVETDTEAQVA